MGLGVSFDFDSAKVEAFFKELQRRSKAIERGEREYALAIGALVQKDVIHHFENEEGPKGRWKEWSRIYTEHMLRIGKAGNQLLQDTGRMRNTLKPSNYRKQSEGLEWYNNAKTKRGFPYAYAHDEGGDILPKRTFMWASNKLMDNVARTTLAFALRGAL
jgi:hypothetical protein